MSDKVIDLHATDRCALAGDFVPQESGITTSRTYGEILEADGNVLVWSNILGQTTAANCTYKYNNSTGLYSALPKLGALGNAYIITSITINSIWNDWPTITIEGHNHQYEPHINDRNQWDLSTFLTLATGEFGVYDWAGLAAGEIGAINSSITASINHSDIDSYTGNHWNGQNITGKLSATINYIGEISNPIVADWLVIDYNNDDDNESHDKTSVTISYNSKAA